MKRKVKAKKVPPKKPLDDSKVMDVSKPGASKPVGTSRPVVTTLGAILGVDKAPAPVKAVVPAAAAPPSQSHRVIAPISENVKPDDAVTPEENEPESSAKDTSEVLEDSESGNPISDNSSVGSESAEVGALADTVASKKAEEKALGEQLKREAVIQELIDSKKYYVPLAHGSTRRGSNKTPLIALMVFLAVVIGGYVAVDSGAVDAPFDLPFHIFKQTTDSPASDDVVTSKTSTFSLAQSGLQVSYDTTIWTKQKTVDSGFGTATSLGVTSKGEYDYGVTFNEFKKPLSASGIVAGLTASEAEKVAAGGKTDLYLYTLVRTYPATSQRATEYGVEMGLAVAVNNQLDTNIPVDGKEYILKAALSLSKPADPTQYVFKSQAEAETWIKDSPEYKNAKAVLTSVKYK